MDPVSRLPLDPSESRPAVVTHALLPSSAPPPAVVRQVVATLLADGSLHYDGVQFTPSCLLPSPPPHPLIAALQPVRSVLHSFLSDEDAARLLRVGRTPARAILPGYAFLRHVFQPDTKRGVRQLKALHATYDLRATRLCLMAELRWGGFTGQSPFPSSLTAMLMAGEGTIDRSGGVEHCTVFDPTVGTTINCLWTQLRHRHPLVAARDEEYHRLLEEESLDPVQGLSLLEAGGRRPTVELPPGLLPPLRRLQLCVDVETQLQVGSLPSTVEVLQIDHHLRLPLVVGALPSSLVHLVMDHYLHPIPPGVLPLSLERLRIDEWNLQLEFGALPSSLKCLQLFTFDQPLLPGALPAGLTHLSLQSYTRVLGEGVLPLQLFSLDLGSRSQRCLGPSVLPPSLRVLWLHSIGESPLIPGLLNDGLEVLHWWHIETINLLPDQLPSSLKALDLSHCDVRVFPKLALPPHVQSLQLPNHFKKAPLLSALPASVAVSFWP